MIEYYRKQTEKLIQENEDLINHNKHLSLLCANLIQDTIELFGQIFPTLPKYDQESLYKAAEQLIMYYQKNFIIVKQYLQQTLNQFYRDSLKFNSKLFKQFKKQEDDVDGWWNDMFNKIQGDKDMIKIEGMDQWKDILETIFEDNQQIIKQIISKRNEQHLQLKQTIIILQTQISKLNLQLTKNSSIISDLKFENDELKTSKAYLQNRNKQNQAKIFRMKNQYELLQHDLRVQTQSLNTQKQLNKELQKKIYQNYQ